MPPPDPKVLRVDRRQSLLECGELIGHLALKIKETAEVQVVSIHCTQPKNHRDLCVFEGTELLIARRRRA